MSDSAPLAWAEREKRRVALSPVAAAVFLTGLKIAVGLLTGSLGIMAEALHSALDLVAAALTYVAVRIASVPADDSHTYGHGKVESFSALIETLLLALTCVWIIYEAVERLLVQEVEVNPSLGAFVVMTVSILIDYTRSRALKRAADRYQSQALEADALHFSTDIWSSLVVILGLLLVKVGQATGHSGVLVHADAVAALGVALIVLWVSGRLGKETIDVLMDRAPRGLPARIAAVAQEVPGVLGCRGVRVRPVGPVLFADLTLDIARNTPLEHAHELASQVELRVRALHPRADVVVHVEPRATEGEGPADRIRAVANRQGLAVHEVQVREVDGQRLVTLHLEVSPDLSLSEAHALADRLEDEVRRELGPLVEVDTHIEPEAEQPPCASVEVVELPEIREGLLAIVAGLPALQGCHAVRVQRQAGRLYITAHCVCDGHLQVEEVHRLVGEIEDSLKQRIPQVARVHIHVEPPEATPPNP